MNAPKAPFADSFLVLRLCQPAPRPLSLPNARREKEFKPIRPEHQDLLAVLIQSKLLGGSDAVPAYSDSVRLRLLVGRQNGDEE